jgi:hypothetical protein
MSTNQLFSRCPILLNGLTGLILTLAIPGNSGCSDSTKEPEALVRDLGSSDFIAREGAQKELAKLGTAALAAIRGGLQSADPEVKRRCELLITQIDDAEWARKAAAYVADRKGKRPPNLPLVKEYEKVAGTGQGARKLFAEALRTNGPFLQSVAEAKDHGLQAYEARCRALFVPEKLLSDGVKIKQGDLASLLLVSIYLKKDSATWKDHANVSHLLGNPGLNEAIKDNETGKAMSALLVTWADAQSATDVQLLQYFLCFVHASDFKDGLKIARKLIKDKDASPLNLRTFAVVVLDKVGGKDSTKEVMKLWDDETKLLTPTEGSTACICDQALGASIRRSGKVPKDYKLNEMSVRLKAPGDTAIDITLYWFASEDERKEIVKKWKDTADNSE